MKFQIAFVLFASLLVSGCGYKLGEIRPTPMRTVRTLAVCNFRNRTYEQRIDVLCADTLVKRLQQDGTYRIVPIEKADAVVNCEITRVEKNGIRSVQNDVLATSEFALRIFVDYEVQDRITGAILIKDHATGSTTFFSGNDLNTIERQALSNAASDMANNIAVALTEGW